MRRTFAFLVAGSLLFAACAEDDPTIGGTGTTGTGATGSTAPATAADCAAANADAFQSPGTLTIGTGNPAFPPWWEGGTSDGSEFEFNDPAKGEGYEGAVAAEVAVRMGSRSRTRWPSSRWRSTSRSRPATKDFDFVLQQISYEPERDDAVDFSDSYYNVNQALVSAEGTDVADATTVADLKDAKLGAPIGTTSLDVITEEIQPTQEPGRLRRPRPGGDRPQSGDDRRHRRRPADRLLHGGRADQAGRRRRAVRGRVRRVLRDGVRDRQPARRVREPRARTR